MRSGTSRRRMTACSPWWRTSTTRASRQIAARRRSFGSSRSFAGVVSVPVEPLLEPGVAALVIAVHLPEPGLVVIEQRDLRDPFGRLPEVQVRDDHPHRTPVLAGQRPALVLPDDPGLAAGD